MYIEVPVYIQNLWGVTGVDILLSLIKDSLIRNLNSKVWMMCPFTPKASCHCLDSCNIVSRFS